MAGVLISALVFVRIDRCEKKFIFGACHISTKNADAAQKWAEKREYGRNHGKMHENLSVDLTGRTLTVFFERIIINKIDRWKRRRDTMSAAEERRAAGPERSVP